MGNLFGKRRSSTPPISQQDQAILQLKNQRDKMKQYMRRNEKQMERQKALAKELIKANKKDRALLILKRKRCQEVMVLRVLQQLDKIEQMVHDLEFSVIEQKVIDELRNGNEALKKMNQLFSIDDIEKIMDETKEAAEYQEEISRLISGQMNDVDMEEVESEFDKLMESERVLNLPEVPIEPLPTVDEAKKSPEREGKREMVMLEAS